MSDPGPTSTPPPGSEAPRPISPARRKRKPRPWMREKEARRRMKQCARDASELVEEASRIAGTLSQNAGVRSLRIGLEALLTILTKIQAMKTKVEGVDTLHTQVTNMKNMLEQLRSQNRGWPEDTQERIEALSGSWRQFAEDAQDVKCRGMIKRFFTDNADATKLQELVEKVNQSIEDFLGALVVEPLPPSQNVVNEFNILHRAVKPIHTHVEMSFLSTYAKNAYYDCTTARQGCLKGTREDVLTDAHNWIKKSLAAAEKAVVAESRTTTAVPGHVLWISGMAGTGKTAIAYSLTEKCAQDDILGAHFFCSRSDAECSDPNHIFVTIARQLCQYYAPFKELVMETLGKDPSLVAASPIRQFENLILYPLRELNGAFPTCVIVIDALDECRDENTFSVILSTLALYIQELVPFLFIVTSRPEPHITVIFEETHEKSLKNSTKLLVLHNVHPNSVLDDIRCYLAHGFGATHEMFDIHHEWPSNQDLNKLVELSNGSFIFATIALRFICSMAHCDPMGQLEALLTASVSIMDDLYRQVLMSAYNKVDTLHKTNPSLRRVLGAITLAEEPLSVAALADLLGMSEGDVRNRLARLRSVLHIPEEGSKDTIRFIHPTFPEFLLDASLEKPEAFHIIPAEHHLTLFTRSLVSMDSLKRNIAGIEQSAAFRSEIPGLSDTVKRCIPAHVAYASRFWSIHLSRCASGTLGQDARDLLHGFLTRQMLYWLEACSLLRVLAGALTALETAEHICQSLGRSFTSLVALLADYHRFLWTYYYCVDTAPLQVYHSALGLAPTESLVRKEYARELDGSLVVRNGALSSWPPRRDSFTGHDGKAVYAITFSSSGDCFFTGGGDHRLKMWKTLTRTLLQSFDGHTGDVNCVAISPDGVHIASGSSDRDVCVWQVSSGECVLTLKGHTSMVYSVAYSADGRCLLSATNKGEVKLWDTADGRCILTLDKTGNDTWQAGLSPDGGVIARGSGASLSLHDVSSATDETFDFPDTVRACTFSPDGRLVAARSAHVIRVWQCADKSLVHSIDVPEMLTSRLAFSRDGARIACGSENGTVYLWLVASEDPPLILPSHTAVVQDVSWSPDGIQVASTGSTTVSIQNTFWWPYVYTSRNNKSDPRLATMRDGHGGQPIRCVSFSPDGSHFATGGDDKAVRVWNAACEPTATMTIDGHRDWLRTVAYSPNGSQIVSGSYDGAVKVWDLLPGPPRSLNFSKTPNTSTRLLGYSAGRCVISTTSWDRSLTLPHGFLVLPDEYPTTVTLNDAYLTYVHHGSVHFKCVSQDSTPTAHLHPPKISGIVVTASLSHNNHYLAYTTSDEICIWSFPNNSYVLRIPVFPGPDLLSFSRNNDVLSCSCDDGSLTLYRVTPGQTATAHVLRNGGRDGRTNDVAWGSLDLQMVSVGQNGVIHSWRTDIDNGPSDHIYSTLTPITVFSRGPASDRCSFALKLPEDGRVQVVGLIDYTSVWDILLQSMCPSGAVFNELSRPCRIYYHWECLTGEQSFPWCSPIVSVSKRGDFVAYPIPSRKSIQIYDLHTGSVRASLPLDEHSAGTCLTAVSPSGLFLVTSSKHGAVTVWELGKEAIVVDYAGWEGTIRTAAFSPDDRFVACGSDNTTLHILDISSTRELQVSPSPQKNVANLMFATNSEHIIAQDEEDRLYVWNISTERGTSCLIHTSSMSDRLWFRSLTILQDDTGICLQDSHGQIREIRLWEPGSRRWPIYDVDEDGWVYVGAPRMGRMQRTCWIPFEWRTILSSNGNVLYLYDHYERRVIGLEFSGLLMG